MASGGPGVPERKGAHEIPTTRILEHWFRRAHGLPLDYDEATVETRPRPERAEIRSCED